MITDADIWRDLQRRFDVASEMGVEMTPGLEAAIITVYAEDHDLPRERVVQVMVDRITMAGGG